jgi:DNA-binding Lrp family transcriptional regulator
MSSYRDIGGLFPKRDITENYHRGNPQSIEANKVAAKYKLSARQRILEELQGDSELTCEDLEAFTKLSHQTCSARISDLKREGKIKQIGIRNTRSGSPAAVYQAI